MNEYEAWSIFLPSSLVLLNLFFTWLLTRRTRDNAKAIESFRIKSEISENKRQEVLTSIYKTLKEHESPDFQKRLFDIMEYSLYYMSDRIFKILLYLKQLGQEAVNTPIKASVMLGSLLLEIRKEMGYNNTDIEVADILNFIINDMVFEHDEVNSIRKQLLPFLD